MACEGRFCRRCSAAVFSAAAFARVSRRAPSPGWLQRSPCRGRTRRRLHQFVANAIPDDSRSFRLVVRPDARSSRSCRPLPDSGTRRFPGLRWLAQDEVHSGREICIQVNAFPGVFQSRRHFNPAQLHLHVPSEKCRMTRPCDRPPADSEFMKQPVARLSSFVHFLKFPRRGTSAQSFGAEEPFGGPPGRAGPENGDLAFFLD